jgi:hypothetical protein
MSGDVIEMGPCRSHRRRRGLVSCLIAGSIFVPFWLLSAGCSEDSDSPVCTTEWVPGIVVTVLDAATGHPAACGAAVWILEGEYVEELEPRCLAGLPDSLQSPEVRGAHERAGVYTVFITKPGYRPWSLGPIVVTEDECHVHRVRLEARLELEP